MSKKIEIPDDVYAQLERHAKVLGLTISQLIVQFEAEMKQARLAAALERLRAKGILLAAAKPPHVSIAVKPIQVQGKPLSETILEERR